MVTLRLSTPPHPWRLPRRGHIKVTQSRETFQRVHFTLPLAIQWAISRRRLNAGLQHSEALCARTMARMIQRSTLS